MRKSFAALLLAIGATAFAANLALAGAALDEDIMSPKLMNASMAKDMRSRATKLGSSGLDPADTMYVGYTPGKFNAANNYWSIWAADDNKPVVGGPAAGRVGHRPPAQAAMWDFDGPYTDVHGDSLQGWWSLRDIMSGAGGLTIPDYNRPWRALDFGNQVNYVFGVGKRTFGVVGMWHVDSGNLAFVPQAAVGGATWTAASAGEPANSGGVKWAPLTGSASAWMGMRRHGDVTHVDDVARGGTGNPYNEDAYVFQQATSVSTGGSDKKFPGYGGQMDQMLYRDVDLSGAGDTTLTVSFQYRTSLSTRIGTNNQSRSGWFQHDPLTVSTGGSDPNFISNNASVANPPADSFMVYVGAPAEGSVELSDGNVHAIYDAQRRWFGEVIRSNEGFYTQIHSSGDSALSTTATYTVPSSVLGPIKTAGSNKVRIVFRVKTNQFFDDGRKQSDAYSSNGAGAAIIDQVRVGKGVAALTTIGAFETPAEIDNRTSVLALNAWKSTGKAPQNFHHAHFLSNGGASATLLYEDLCGQVSNEDRICDMRGVVVSAGDHDNDERSGGTFGTAEQEPFQGIFSPVINLSAGAGDNSNGLTNQDADPTEDYYGDYEIYTGIFDFFNQGNAWRMGFQSYPGGNTASGAGEHHRWGDTRYLPFIYFNPDKQCFRGFEPVFANGMLRTTSPDGLPDSCRIYFGTRQEAYRFGITTSEWLDGAYWDNLSFAIVDGAGSDPISMSIWDLYHDTFPANDNISAVNIGVPAVFDTTVALIRSGINIAPSPGNQNRFDVPGDTTAVQAEGDNVRLDMIFRILPGPGNYVSVGNGTTALRAVANSATPAPAPSALSSNFWSSYMGDNGAWGTGGNGTSGPGHGATWSPHRWNSARMDTAQANVFQMHGRGIITPAGAGVFQTTYHESEARGAAGRLGIPRNICFVAEPGALTSTQAIICGSGNVPSGVTYPPAWVTDNTTISGYNGSSTTVEGTKIIPDGLLTPGSHVEYFFRRQDIGAPLPNVFLGPDTAIVTPQNSEGSTDAHRWQQFGVLPDTWKRSGYTHPVLSGSRAGLACMLYVDQNDRRGNERTWVGVADSIGATRAEKYGAHNGWHAKGDGSDLEGDGTSYNPAVPTGPGTFIRAHLGQPGTTWDMYGVKAAESLNTGSGSIGSRGGVSAFSFSSPANIQIDPKTSRQGPSLDMLEAYYRILFFLTGDLNSSIFGPFTNKSQDDFDIMQLFLSGSSVGTPRGYFAEGDGFVQSNYDPTDLGNPSDIFMTDYLGVRLVPGHYRFNEPNFNDEADITSTTAVDGPGPTYLYGVRNTCTYTLDVLDDIAGLSNPATFYENTNAGPAWISGVVQQPASSLNPWFSLVDGWDIENLTSSGDVSASRRNTYFLHVFQNIFDAICDVHGAPVTTGDTPGNNDGRLFNFMSLSNNPLKSGSATINFGIAKSERVKIQIFDVGGRLIRTLADRKFTAGEHKLTWDGVDNSGGMSARGVYFVRSKHADSQFTGLSKLIVLK